MSSAICFNLYHFYNFVVWKWVKQMEFSDQRLKILIKSTKNQRFENAGVAFVKGANERNGFFEKINNQ